MKKSSPLEEDRIPGSTHLADVPMRDVRRGMLTLVLFLIVLGLFLSMVHEMLVAGLLGGIIGAYLRPFHNWIEHRTKKPTLAAITTLFVLIVPALVLLVYGYVEIRDAAEYLAAHTAEVATQINEALGRLPFVGPVDDAATIETRLASVASLAMEAPQGLQAMLSEFAVDTSIFLFTAFYVLTQADTLAEYLRAKVPARYKPLAVRLEKHVHGVLYGAVYSMLVTQTLKALLVLVLCLIFGVPLPIVLALITFIIGFFPVVGSWTVVLPAAGYLLVFQNSPWEALAMAVIGIVVSTVLISMLLRPKLAAEQSKILNFYWMFVALIAGVYTFGVPGIVIGPIVVGLLKAIFDTITTDQPWAHNGEEELEATVFDETAEQGSPPDEEA